MTELLVVNGLLRDQLVMIVLLVSEWSDSRPARDDRGSRDPHRSDRMERDDNRQRSSFDGARDKSPNKKAFFEDVVLEKLQSVDAGRCSYLSRVGRDGSTPTSSRDSCSDGCYLSFPNPAGNYSCCYLR